MTAYPPAVQNGILADAWQRAQARRATRTAQRTFEFRGAALELQTCDEPEVIISGPADTGKTIAGLSRLHRLMCEYPGAQGVIVRKTFKSAIPSVVQSFIKKVLPPNSGVTIYGGERAEWFDYPNGSRLWVGGMDNPDKVLSSERDVVYVNQVEELTLNDWEYLTTRANGRAGNLPFGQVYGDCNPGPAQHWIIKRAGLRIIESRHEDNPEIFNKAGQITATGQRRMAVLDKLTGVRRERLRLGRWVNAEGTVYEFDDAIHLMDQFPIPPSWRRIRVIDFGYTNPFVCQWWTIDGDGRMYLYREMYMSKRTVSAHSIDIVNLSEHERILETIADHDAEDRATLEENGVTTTAAEKAITTGIQAVQDRLLKAGDGKPRLFILRDALVERDEVLAEARKPVNTHQEFSVYMWPKAADGKPLKETPIDADNHGMDCIRYAVAHIDGGANAAQPGATDKANPRTASAFVRSEQADYAQHADELAGGRFGRDRHTEYRRR